MSSLKIRARRQDGYTLLRVLISHPMETGRRKTEQEQPIPAHYIRNVQIALNETLISECLFSTSVSRNPYISLHLPASQPGDRLRVSWQDNLGQSDSDEVLVE